MGDSGELTVPAGYYPPFAIITKDDHGGWIIIATALGIALALLSIAIRFHVKWISSQRAGADDVLLAASAMFAFIQESVILAACARGLGRSVSLLNQSSLRYVEKSFYTSQLFAILALSLCKCSIASFITRLTPQTSIRRILHVYVGVVILWTVAAIFALALQCDLGRPWTLATNRCSGVYARLVVIGIVDALLEAWLFACAVLLVMRLQTKFRKKAVVLLAFGLRLPIIAIIAARVDSFDRLDLGNFSRGLTIYIIWTTSQINFSIISTTLPILRPFIKDLTTFYGALRPSEYSGSDYRVRSNAFHLSAFRTKKSDGSYGADKGSANSRNQGSSTKTKDSDAFDFGHPRSALEGITRTEIEAREARPSRPNTRISDNSLETDSSQRMIIRVETEWEVSREESS
ncbi:hypothetical protein AC579_7371 [Pseudocercospora musae]|uniref:Rhodopsin domain-containing protein n=1 Tax=Pseudocercospora musae TaxID=113226 RepID=A0A139ICM3_9PEZI|nr:hypothetical protein AC579_7371 [Pseudocercospora musae]